jgi:hypothetical protein
MNRYHGLDVKRLHKPPTMIPNHERKFISREAEMEGGVSKGVFKSTVKFSVVDDVPQLGVETADSWILGRDQQRKTGSADIANHSPNIIGH